MKINVIFLRTLLCVLQVWELWSSFSAVWSPPSLAFLCQPFVPMELCGEVRENQNVFQIHCSQHLILWTTNNASHLIFFFKCFLANRVKHAVVNQPWNCSIPHFRWSLLLDISEFGTWVWWLHWADFCLCQCRGCRHVCGGICRDCDWIAAGV